MAKSKSLTVAQLVAAALVLQPTMTEDKVRAMLKEKNVKSMKRITEVFSKPQAARRIRTERVVEAGPRGFRFGEVWNTSVKAGSFPATHPSNLAKLKAHATAQGVSSAGTDPEKIAALIAPTL